MSARLRAEDGFTLVEMLVVIALLPIVLIALLKTFDTSVQLVPRSVEYANAVGETGNGAALIIRDLRQAYRVVGATANSVTFNAAINGTDSLINISCNIPSPVTDDSGSTYRRCVKTTTAAGGTLGSPSTGTVLVDRLVNGTPTDPVFVYSPDPISPTYIQVKLRVPSRGEGKAGFTHPITIDNGTLLRNYTLGS